MAAADFGSFGFGLPMTPADRISFLTDLFLEYYDDCIMSCETSVKITARAARVLSAVVGQAAFNHCLRQWVREGDVAELGSRYELDSEQPCLEIRNFVNPPAPFEGT